jgi:pilus assembly protein Flp/PilA
LFNQFYAIQLCCISSERPGIIRFVEIPSEGCDAIRSVINQFCKDERGVTAIEYGLIAAFIGVGIIVSLGPLKTALNTLFNNVKTNVSR